MATNKHSILVTSNKCEFQNYFSDPLKIVENSEIAMTKAIISIPVRANEYITIPGIDTTDVAYMASPVLNVSVDGILKRISWTEIYNAYVALDNQIDDTLTIEEFYSGEYRLPLSNFVVYWDTVAGQSVMRPNINEIFSTALNNKFIFYAFGSKPGFTMTDANTINWGESVTLKGQNFIIRAMRNQSLSLGFIVDYKQFVDTDMTPCTTANTLLWTSVNTMTVTDDPVGCDIISTAGGGVDGLYDSIAQLNRVVDPVHWGKVDPNGGFFRFKLNSMGAVPNTQAVVGFVRGLEGGIDKIAQMPIEDIEFGVLFDYDGTDIFIQVIDGGYDAPDNNAHPNAVNKRYARLTPEAQFNTTALNEYFFLQINRNSNAMPDSGSFSFKLFKSSVGDWAENDEPVLIFNSTYSINTPLDLVPVFLANRADVEIKELQMIPLTQDSRLQLDPTYRGGFGAHANLNFAEPRGIGNMEIYIDPGYGFDDLDEDVIRFWGNLGLYTGDNGYGKIMPSTNGFAWNYDIPRQPAEVAYSFGDIRWQGIFYEKVWLSGARTIAYNDINATLPRLLEVRVNDLNVVTSSGSFVGSTLYDDNVVNRIVGTIPVPAEYLNTIGAFDMDISYEPYNLIYRTLRNINEIMVNQLNIKVSAKNFETNTEDDIRNINGTLKIEFHIKKE